MHNYYFYGNGLITFLHFTIAVTFPALTIHMESIHNSVTGFHQNKGKEKKDVVALNILIHAEIAKGNRS